MITPTPASQISSSSVQWRPRRLFVNTGVRNHPWVEQIVARFPELSPQLVETHEEVYAALNRYINPEAVGKRWLYLARHTGQFLKPCPGLDPQLACCNLWVLNTAIGCPLDCTYCFLQTYLPRHLVTLFVNLDDLERELDALLASQPGRFFRVCTGELSDSLALDPLFACSRRLVEIFTARPRLSIELKTKTDDVAALHGLNHRGRVVVSWTLNAPAIASHEEHGAASLQARLSAARRAASWGYRVGFHFDPIVEFPGWQAEYESVVEMLFDSISDEAIAWISLGTLRFDRGLKSIVQRRFPSSRIIYGEFIPGPDGKMRYPAPLRAELYRRLADAVRARSSRVPLYLCMESYQMWQRALGTAPCCRRDVAAVLQSSLDGAHPPADADKASGRRSR
ncbi:MAG: hypothetical protein Kow0059_06960 [Candidatus Sumerlaeia bacterium]